MHGFFIEVGLFSTLIAGLERVHGFTFGDSLDVTKRSKWVEFRTKLEKVQILKLPVSFLTCRFSDIFIKSLPMYVYVLVSFFGTSTNFVQLKSLEEPWTLIIDDALANSFIAPATDEIKDDTQLSCKF